MTVMRMKPFQGFVICVAAALLLAGCSMTLVKPKPFSDGSGASCPCYVALKEKYKKNPNETVCCTTVIDGKTTCCCGGGRGSSAKGMKCEPEEL